MLRGGFSFQLFWMISWRPVEDVAELIKEKKEAWMKQELVFGKGFLVKSHEGNGIVPIPIPVGLVL